MAMTSITLRNAVTRALYRRVARPVFFRQDPETTHDRMKRLGAFLGRHRLTRELTWACFGYTHPSLTRTVAGIRFANPIGLAAGFDKNGQLTQIMPSVGFGFMEVGSVTGRPCPGNPKPRLWRLPKSRALVVHLGLNSDGSEVVRTRLLRLPKRFPLGVSIAKTNDTQTDNLEAGIADYAKAADDVRSLADYVTINISCPNTMGGEPFSDPANLTKLLQQLNVRSWGKPAFMKLPVDLPFSRIDAVLDVALAHGVTGFICSNLTKRRDVPALANVSIPPKGGISGKVVEPLANAQLRHVFRHVGKDVPLIGVGGVFTAEDAYRKIRLGASLIQVVTGLVYQGPSMVSDVTSGLVGFLKRDKITLEQAVGADA